MRFEDIKAGMRLWGDVGTVTDKGETAWGFRYDGEERRQFRSEWAVYFVPVEPQPDPLAGHPAVTGHGKGVSSDDVASFTEALASLAQSRVKGTGHEQYGQGKLQRFEEDTSDELVTGLLEEAADAINYIAMAMVKFLAAANVAKDRL